MKLLHRPDGHIVIARHQRAVGNPALTQALHPRRPGFRRPAPFGDKRLVQGDAVASQRVFVAGEAFDAGGRVKGAGNKGDIAMAKRNQPLHYPHRRGFLIGPDAVAGVAAQAAIKHHDRLRVVLNDLVHLIDGEKARVDDDRIAAQIQQVLDRLPLLLRAVLAVGQDQLPPFILRHPRHVIQQFAKIDAVVQGIGHHQAEGLRGFGRQVARQQIRPVAALRHRLKHPVFGLLADIAVARQHPRNGRLRYPRALCDLQHRCHVILPVAKVAGSVLHVSRFYSTPLFITAIRLTATLSDQNHKIEIIFFYFL
ncbi:hypothetical protein J047_06003 [Klebsiella pneumoniae 160_1080]|nr:hypothetical protein J047_06003 [Klebsiella pneumoniae 160_1080]